MPGCNHCEHDHHHHDAPPAAASPRYRRVLWVALWVNLGMFGVEVASGFEAGSMALLADALDFFGDAANYGVSLFVLGLGLATRAKAALLKGASLGLFGLGVLAATAYNAWHGIAPEPWTMGTVAVLALLANVGVALMLYRWRDGDANMQSVWLCSRNDAIGNVAVVLAAACVAWLNSPWPDWAVAVLMAGLGLSAAKTIVWRAMGELGWRW